MAFAPSFPVRSLDDVRRLEAVPLEEAIGVQSTYELFVASAGAFGDKPALRFLESADPDDETIVWTYAELLANIRGTANMLHGLGVGPGDAVSILMPACLEYHLALWGGEAAGIVNPLNPLLAEDKLVELMLASKTKVLIAWRDETEGNYWQKALAAAAQVEGLEAVLRVGPRPPGGTLPKDFAKDVFGFQELLAAQPDDRLVSGRRILPGDTAAYFHTGGTTGSPKLAMHTHGNQVFTAWASVKMLGISDQ
ncbi:MAG: AMP-binding protein, partial [Pseudomonadota bacterium]